MQKKIIALAIASAFVAPVAMAESSFYGSMDGGVRMQTYDDGTNPSYTTFSMKMGQYNTSRWGFKGVDDIGNGVKANVVVETSFVPAGVGANPDLNPTYYVANGNNGYSLVTAGGEPSLAQNNPFGLIFDRQATVGLESSTMGRFDMGWNYTASYDVIGTYDPMGYKFINTALAYTASDRARAGNVKYQIDVAGMHIIAEYDINDAFGGNVQQGNRAAQMGTGRAIGVTYAAAGFNVGAAYTTTDGDLVMGPMLSPNNKSTHFTVGGGYDFGAGKVSVGYAKKSMKFENYGNDANQTDMWIGGSFNVSSKAALSAAYYTRAYNDAMQQIGAVQAWTYAGMPGPMPAVAPGSADLKQNVVMLMGTYSLSKMSTLYVEYDSQDLKDGAMSAQVKASGFSAGLDVKF